MISSLVAAATALLMGDMGLPRPDSPPVPGSDGTESPEDDSDELEVDRCLASTSSATVGGAPCCCCPWTQI